MAANTEKSRENQTEISFDFSKMRSVYPVPSLNLPDIVEIECLEPLDGSEYRVFVCEGKQPWYGRQCPFCNSYSTESKGRMDEPRLVHDVNVGCTRIDIVLYADRAECRECGKTFTRQFEGIVPGKQATNRLYDQIRRDSIRLPFSDVGTLFGYSDTTIGDIFDKYIEELEAKRGSIIAPHALGIDEKHIVHAMRAVFVDLDTGILLEMRPNNKREDIISTIESMIGYDENIKIVTMDMSNGYRAYVEECLPRAKIIVDKYHVYQDLSQKVTKTKTRIMDELSSQIGSIKDLKEKRRLEDIRSLATRFPYLFKFSIEKLQEKEFRIAAMADLCSTFPEFNHLRLLKEGFERIYDCKTRSEAERAYDEWETLVPPGGKKQTAVWEAKYGVKAELFAEFRVFRNAMTNWHKEVFNYFDEDCGYTNAAAEGMNKLIQNINSQGNGYSFARLRGKALFWSTAAPRIKYSFDKTSIPKTRYKEKPSLAMGFLVPGSFDQQFETYYQDVILLTGTEDQVKYRPLSVYAYAKKARQENPEGYID